MKIKHLQTAFLAVVLGIMSVNAQSDALAPPSNVRVNPLAYNQVKVSWRDNSSDERSFEIQRSANGVNYTSLGTVGSDVVSYIDTKVSAFAPYIYRVCAVSGATKSEFAVSNSIITPAFTPLTSLTDGGYYTASDKNNNSPSGEVMDNLFDNNPATKYLTRTNTTWVAVEFNTPYTVAHYSITSANDTPNRDPRAWRLEGSANGTSWTTLDTRSSEVFDSRFQKRFFEVANPASYKFYRLNVTQNRGDGNTQFADWLLYADVPALTGEFTPATPANFRVDVRSCHHIKLSWDDVRGETGYRIERSEDGGATYTHTYEIDANNVMSFPYALKPETNYRFKLYAVNGDKQSTPVYVDALTPAETWIERWENLNLWIFDTPITVVKVKQIGNVAFYMLEKDNASMINDLYFNFYAQNWEYVYETYGNTLSDRRLHVFLFPLDDGGGLASIYDYRADVGGYRNMVYIKAYKDWFTSRSESGYIYDVMAHELCHIVEGVGGGYNGSMFYPVWGDSKWAEILQYDLFKKLAPARATSWHYEFTHGSGGAEYPDASRTSYWYKDFLYPTYEKYGETEMLQRFWQLLGQYYRHKDGDFIGSSTNPSGRGNLGELIHFWSAAAQMDVKKEAINAFGWNDEFEMWLLRAKVDFPKLQYDSPPIDVSEKNICQDGGAFTSNITSSNNILNLNDLNYGSIYTVRQSRTDSLFVLTYNSAAFAKINKYLIAVRDTITPASWTLSGSSDGEHWDFIDRQSSPDFAANDNKISVNVTTTTAYRYFRWEFDFKPSTSTSQIKLTEVELHGIGYASSPSDLRAVKKTESSVFLDWLCPIEEVASINIERSTDGSQFELVASVSPYEIAYTDENLTPGAYYYRVSAINQHPDKGAVYSNIAFVNTTLNGLPDLQTSDLSFYETLRNLDRYPDNKVKIYSVLGQEVFAGSGLGNDLLYHIQSHFRAGVYVVKIQTTQGNVSGKVVVK